MDWTPNGPSLLRLDGVGGVLDSCLRGGSDNVRFCLGLLRRGGCIADCDWIGDHHGVVCSSEAFLAGRCDILKSERSAIHERSCFDS